ncbi:MAG: hypothetical protein ABH816_02895 [Candidatus Levyibacteriota bacterium]
MKNTNRSRLARRLEKQSAKTFWFSILGIIIIIFLLVKFGIPLLVNLSMFATGSKGETEPSTQNSSSYIAVPLLNPILDATNSAKLNISGNASKDETIDLYINEEIVDKTSTKDDGSFMFDKIILSKGENSIKVKAVVNDNQEKKESDFSQTYTITLKNDAPNLSVDTPNEGQSFSKDDNPIIVSGSTEAGNKVTVNGFWAIVDGNGRYSYNLKLQNGDNEIVINSTDPAGNQTEMKRKVTYSQ